MFFQLWYKLKKQLPWKEQYNRYKNCEVKRLKCDAFELISATGKYLGNNSFIFLNQEHHFNNDVDWNFSLKGKLWNYNLQYFDYILDDKYDVEQHVNLLEHCCMKIIGRTLPMEPYPASLRIVNWLLFYSKTGYSSKQFLNTLKYQIAYLEKNQEYHILANHLLENKMALTIAAMYLGDGKLLKTSLIGLKDQIEEQILADGAHYECTPMYHCIILSKLLLIKNLIVLNQINTGIDQFLDRTIGKMLGWINAFIFKNGDYALFNDATNGIAVTPHILNTIAARNGIVKSSTKMNESGYRKLETENCEIIVDVGNIIPSYQPGHSHSDMFSFCMNVNDAPVFVDPGISTYQVNAQRSKERSTAFHNTVCINDESQSQVWSGFRVGRRAKVMIENDTEHSVVASHDGYRKALGMLHRRSFKVESDSIVIKDEIIEERRSTPLKLLNTIAFFYFDHSISLAREEGSVMLNAQLQMLFDNSDGIEIIDYQQPLGYNIFKPSKALKVLFNKSLITTIKYTDESAVYN